MVETGKGTVNPKVVKMSLYVEILYVESNLIIEMKITLKSEIIVIIQVNKEALCVVYVMNNQTRVSG